MKTVVLIMAIVVSALMITSGINHAATTHTPEDAELRALLESRREVLKSLSEVMKQRAAAGSGILNDVTDINSELLDVELELARTKDERVALLEAALVSQVQIEQRVQSMFNSGVLNLSDNLVSQANRLKIEVELHKAKTSP